MLTRTREIECHVMAALYTFTEPNLPSCCHGVDLDVPGPEVMTSRAGEGNMRALA